MCLRSYLALAGLPKQHGFLAPSTNVRTEALRAEECFEDEVKVFQVERELITFTSNRFSHERQVPPLSTQVFHMEESVFVKDDRRFTPRAGLLVVLLFNPQAA